MTALELTPEGQIRVMPLSVIQELIHERNFKATSIACFALADIEKEEK